ncbi:MAG: B12-binding domain-containing radical SAM protein [Phycisphaerales bacterium]|nr:B12-binding domain-containing radical SAM protein [Phycisphaerales bacterium]
MVGVSCLFSAQADMAHHVCKLIKQIDASIRTIMGGAHPSSVPDEVLADTHVDIVVIGEGEMVLRKLVGDLSKGVFPPTDTSALAFREGDRIRVFPPTSYIEDLDVLPMPARHLLPMQLYFRHAAPHGGAVKRHPVTNMITSRGCPAQCCFCSIHTVWGRIFRVHRPERVIQEIESLIHDYGVREIQFEDDNLTLNRNRIQDICRVIVARRIDITWSTPNGVAIYALDKPTLRLMRQAGCHHISIAIESGCQRVLNEIIHKPLQLSKVSPIIRAARKNGIGVSVFFVIGFPGETMEEIRGTITYGLKMRVDAVLFFTAMPYPGTELLNECLARGLLCTPVNYAQMRINYPMFDT